MSLSYDQMSRDELLVTLTALQHAGNAGVAEAQLYSPAEIEHLQQELRAHQIELELQRRDLREAQQALEASRERYADLYDFAPVGYLTLDAARRIVEINLTGAAMLGVERDHLLGKSFAPYIAQADRAAFQGHLARCHRTEALVVSEIDLLARGGVTLRVQLSSACRHGGEQPSLCALTLTDISARARAERELQLSEARYRTTSMRLQTLVEAAPLAVIVLSPAGLVQLWNPAAERLYGWPADEALGRPLPTVPAEQWEAFQELLARVIAGETIAGVTAHRRRRDGTRLDVLLAAAPLPDSTGAIDNVLYLIQDLTELEEVRANNARLAMLSQRFLYTQEAERRRLAHVLHNEIGQALTALKFDLELASDDLGGAQGSQAVDNGIAIIAQLLHQIRVLALELRPFVLDDLGLVAALRSSLDRLAQRGNFEQDFRIEGAQAARLEIERLPQAVEIVCFRAAQEALTNVLRHAHARHVTLTLCVDGDAITLRIRDDGVGFDSESAQRRASAGESMGLLALQEQIRLAGGTITIDTALGRGTSVEMRIPLVADVW